MESIPYEERYCNKSKYDSGALSQSEFRIKKSKKHNKKCPKIWNLYPAEERYCNKSKYNSGALSNVEFRI